jgi:tetratricopeptide (TPR) repeat protein
VAIWHFWLIRSHLVEGAEWLDTALERGQRAPTSVRARLLNGRAWIAAFQGDYRQVSTLCEESLPLARGAQATRQIAIALVLLARAAAEHDDPDRAASLSEEARALALVEGDNWSLLLATLELSYCRLWQGDYQQAAALAQEGVASSREIGERIGGANCLLMLGKTALKLGDGARARDSLREALVTFEGLGDRWGIASCVGDLALVAEAEREPMRAATLLGAAKGVQEAFGVHMRRFEAQDYDRSVAAVRAVLGEKTFAAAWAAGRAMPLEEAVAYALEGSDG